MRYKFKPEQKDQTISFAVAGIIVLLFYFIVQNIPVIHEKTSELLSVMLPFVVGFGIAFVVTPLMNWIESKILQDTKLSQKIKRSISAISAMTVVIVFISLAIYILLPQLISSIETLLIQFPLYIETAEKYISELILQSNIRPELTDILIGSGEDLLESLGGFIREYLPRVLSYSFQFANLIFRVFLGLIIALYILIDRERFARQFKNITYALFSRHDADRLVRLTNLSAKTFNNFIIGKTIDSIIIGLLCFLGMTIFNWPYAILISFIIGVTNMIPVFGPFIGAIPSIFILFIVNPMITLWFALFILLLQQLDGNIIGPMILGDSMGLPSLWIMFAIIVGGGFFGIIGMFLGVPIFAVVYLVVKEIVNFRLREKGIDMVEKNTSD